MAAAPPRARALLLALPLLVAATAPPGRARPASLPQLRGVQGVDDEVAVDALRAAGDAAGLDARYAALERDFGSGLRRYNFFWSDLEGRVPPGAAPFACPPGSALTPANSSERDRLGYVRFHCYDSAKLAAFDDTLARDARAGAASAFIVYGSPGWAMDPGCTGFPWPPNPNYRSGCIPWGHFDDWQDFVLTLTARWSAPWGSGRPRLSALCMCVPAPTGARRSVRACSECGPAPGGVARRAAAAGTAALEGRPAVDAAASARSSPAGCLSPGAA